MYVFKFRRGNISVAILRNYFPLALVSSLFPLVGPIVGGILIAHMSLELKTSAKYIVICSLTSSLGALILYASYAQFRAFLFPLLLYSMASPPLVYYLYNRPRKKISVEYSEDVIEIKVTLKGKYQALDPNELFNAAYEAGIRKIKNPYYLGRLREVKNCSSLKVRAAENVIILRRDCGNLKVEVVVGGSETKFRVQIPY
jgi:hypothetical protein